MMHIDLNSAYEIVTHRDDLHICICREEQREEQYSLMFFRGPGHSFTDILTMPPYACTRSQAVRAVQVILESALVAVVSKCLCPQSQIAQSLNVVQGGINLSALLTEHDIRRIVYRLRRQDTACTYDFLRGTRAGYLSHQVQ